MHPTHAWAPAVHHPYGLGGSETEVKRSVAGVHAVVASGSEHSICKTATAPPAAAICHACMSALEAAHAPGGRATSRLQQSEAWPCRSLWVIIGSGSPGPIVTATAEGCPHPPGRRRGQGQMAPGWGLRGLSTASPVGHASPCPPGTRRGPAGAPAAGRGAGTMCVG